MEDVFDTMEEILYSTAGRSVDVLETVLLSAAGPPVRVTGRSRRGTNAYKLRQEGYPDADLAAWGITAEAKSILRSRGFVLVGTGPTTAKGMTYDYDTFTQSYPTLEAAGRAFKAAQVAEDEREHVFSSEDEGDAELLDSPRRRSPTPNRRAVNMRDNAVDLINILSNQRLNAGMKRPRVSSNSNNNVPLAVRRRVMRQPSLDDVPLANRLARNRPRDLDDVTLADRLRGRLF